MSFHVSYTYKVRGSFLFLYSTNRNETHSRNYYYADFYCFKKIVNTVFIFLKNKNSFLKIIPK